MFLYTTLLSDSGEAGPLVQHQMHGHLESLCLIFYFQIACVIDVVILLRAGDKYIISRAYCLVMPTSYYAEMIPWHILLSQHSTHLQTFSAVK